MGDYNVFRIYAKLDREFATLIQRLVRERFKTEDDEWIPAVYGKWTGRPGQLPPDMPQVYGLVSCMRMCYHDVFYDNLGFVTDEKHRETGPFDEQVVLEEGCGILNVYFSYKIGYSLEQILKDIADHLILDVGQSIVFAMSQSEYDFYDGRIDYWIASRGDSGTNVTTAQLQGDIRENPFQSRMIEPFPTAWLNPSFHEDNRKELPPTLLKLAATPKA